MLDLTKKYKTRCGDEIISIFGPIKVNTKLGFEFVYDVVIFAKSIDGEKCRFLYGYDGKPNFVYDRKNNHDDPYDLIEDTDNTNEN